MVRTFLKVYMELGSSFLFLQEQIKDIIIITAVDTPRLKSCVICIMCVFCMQMRVFSILYSKVLSPYIPRTSLPMPFLPLRLSHVASCH